MIETVIAVLIVVSSFLALFKLSHMLTCKILLEHAAMRVARARAVGLNDFMCLKAARICVSPVAGRRLWPTGEDALDADMENARLRLYLLAKDEAVARGILEYEGWGRLSVDVGSGTDAQTRMEFGLFDGLTTWRLDGAAGVENNYRFYMDEQGR